MFQSRGFGRSTNHVETCAIVKRTVSKWGRACSQGSMQACTGSSIGLYVDSWGLRSHRQVSQPCSSGPQAVQYFMHETRTCKCFPNCSKGGYPSAIQALPLFKNPELKASSPKTGCWKRGPHSKAQDLPARYLASRARSESHEEISQTKRFKGPILHSCS